MCYLLSEWGGTEVFSLRLHCCCNFSGLTMHTKSMQLLARLTPSHCWPLYAYATTVSFTLLVYAIVYTYEFHSNVESFWEVSEVSTYTRAHDCVLRFSGSVVTTTWALNFSVCCLTIGKCTCFGECPLNHVLEFRTVHFPCVLSRSSTSCSTVFSKIWSVHFELNISQA